MVYEGMVETAESATEVVADDVGISFIVGTVAGFTYHLLKGISSSRRNFYFKRSFILACHKGPQVGGIGAGFAAAADAVQIADVKIIAGSNNSYLSEFFFPSTVAAARLALVNLMFAVKRSS